MHLNSLNMTMVVARYNEDLDWLKPVPWNYIVFNKGEDNLPKWIKNVVKLPNIGREAHTYLTYIISNYDSLPEYSIFVQGNPFDHTRKLIEKIDSFDGRHDYFRLSDKTVSSGLSRGLTHSGLKSIESARKIFIDDIAYLVFSRGAQFIVSKKAILFHTKLTYQKIMDFMIEGIYSGEISTEGRSCRKDCDFERPFSTWIMERLWLIVFDSRHKTIYD